MPDRAHERPRRMALITGASSGIGEAFADVFAAGGFDLVLTARRQERLDMVAHHVRRTHGCRVEVIAADLSEPGAASGLHASIVERGLIIDTLVNNAGYGVPGAYVASSWSRQEASLRVLVLSLTELTYRFLPGMIERGDGRVLNVASLAGLMPAPGGLTLYPASKAFVITFSEALAQEVRDAGVSVTALAPGFTDTAFHDVAATRERVRALPRLVWDDARSVARCGYDAVMAGQPLVIPGRVNRVAAYVVRVLPRSLLHRLARTASRPDDITA